MLQPIVIASSVLGLGLALFALLAPGTGVTLTLGAALAVTGALATLVGLLLLATARMRAGLHWLVAVLTVVAAGLTGVAAWFLMQNILAAVMALVCLCSVAVAARTRPLSRI